MFDKKRVMGVACGACCRDTECSPGCVALPRLLTLSVSHTCHKNEHGGESQPHVGDCFTFKENQYTKDHGEIPVCVGTSPCATARSRADVRGSWGLTCQWVRIPMRGLCSHTQSGASWKVQVQRTCERWGFVSLPTL